MTKTETQALAQLTADGWRVYRNGWPDFLGANTMRTDSEALGKISSLPGSFLSEAECFALDSAKQNQQLGLSFDSSLPLYFPLPQIPVRLPFAFFKRVLFHANGCWQWLGKTVCDPKYPWKRYGTYTLNFRRDDGEWAKVTRVAHRFSYEEFVGPVSAKMHLDHLCENKLCVNPEHLEQVTCSENKLRSPARKRERGEPVYVRRTS